MGILAGIHDWTENFMLLPDFIVRSQDYFLAKPLGYVTKVTGTGGKIG
jgi:hypothetical protein